jgi:hypothetical protein
VNRPALNPDRSTIDGEVFTGFAMMLPDIYEYR